MFSRLTRRALPVSVFLLLLCCMPGITFAQQYGNNAYGSCMYGSSCATANSDSTTSSGTPDSVFQAPGGLEIAVNLRNGQVVPASGYTIIVTPLNGRGSSFQTVTFSINGAPAHVMQPASDGTAQWLWLPHEYPGTRITIEVLSADGQTAVARYTIILTGVLNGVSANASSVTPVTANTVIGRFITWLPYGVVQSIPYALFFLLVLSMLVAALQIVRELTETDVIRADLAQLRIVAKSKRDFISLVSHYLRTPLTLLQGGLESLPNETPRLASLQQLVAELHTKAEALIGGYESMPIVDQAAVRSVRVFRSVRFWLPASITGLLAFYFDYLADNSGALSVHRIDIYKQFVIFVALASASYVVIRMLQLRRQDAAELRRVLNIEATLLAKREQFVVDVVAALSQTSIAIQTEMHGLPSGNAVKFMRDGATRLEVILAKCQTAVALRGGSSTQPIVTIRGRAFLEGLVASQARKAAEHRITLSITNDADVACHDAKLLREACQHVLDNAVAFAPDGSTVTLSSAIGRHAQVVTITDHGPGIGEEKLRQLLEPFAKGEGADTFDHEGAGLSLYLDKLIMTYLGGSIDIHSASNKQTSVQLSLPVRPR